MAKKKTTRDKSGEKKVAASVEMVSPVTSLALTSVGLQVPEMVNSAVSVSSEDLSHLAYMTAKKLYDEHLRGLNLSKTTLETNLRDLSKEIESLVATMCKDAFADSGLDKTVTGLASTLGVKVKAHLQDHANMPQGQPATWTKDSLLHSPCFQVTWCLADRTDRVFFTCYLPGLNLTPLLKLGENLVKLYDELAVIDRRIIEHKRNQATQLSGFRDELKARLAAAKLGQTEGGRQLVESLLGELQASVQLQLASNSGS